MAAAGAVVLQLWLDCSGVAVTCSFLGGVLLVCAPAPTMVAVFVVVLRHVCMRLRSGGLCLLADCCSVEVGGLPGLLWLLLRPFRVPTVAVVFCLCVLVLAPPGCPYRLLLLGLLRGLAAMFVSLPGWLALLLCLAFVLPVLGPAFALLLLVAAVGPDSKTPGCLW